MDLSLFAYIGQAIFWLLVLASVLAFGALLILARQEHDKAPIGWAEALIRVIAQDR